MRSLVIVTCLFSLIACSGADGGEVGEELGPDAGDAGELEADAAGGRAGEGGTSGGAGTAAHGGTAGTGSGGMAGTTGGSSGGAGVAGTGGGAGVAGKGGSAGAAGSSGGTGGTAGKGGSAGTGGSGGAATCPSACRSVNFAATVSSPPATTSGTAEVRAVCPAGSTLDLDWPAYCFNCDPGTAQKLPNGGRRCFPMPSAPAGSVCTIQFRCDAERFCVEWARPCP